MKILDLRFGHPEFMNYIPSPWLLDDFKPEFKTPKKYQLVGSDVLKDSIRKLHTRYQNAAHEDKFIIIGHGATQILYAALYAMSKIKGTDQVIASSPHFIRFPKIVELSGLHWNERYKSHDDTIQIVTSPNNPDGKIQHSYRPNTIHDLCYNWPQYLEMSPINEDEEIMVFSLAKALGYASTRIGWAIVKDPHIATLMEEYIEFTTSGISIEAQREAYTLIEISLIEHPSPYILGKIELSNRWKKIRLLNNFPFDIISSNGMFLWFKGDNIPDYFRTRNILYVNGKDCGADSSYGRINIGCSSLDFNDLLERLK